MKSYNELELVHTNTAGKLFRDPNDWNAAHYGYPDINDICIVAICAPNNQYETWYVIATYTKGGFEEINKNKIIKPHDVLAWKRTELFQ